MRNLRRRLLTLHSDERFLGRLRRTAAPHFSLHVVSGWEALREGYALSPPGTIVVLDPYHGRSDRDGSLATELPVFLAHFPSAVVVAAFWLRQGTYRDTWTLSQLGVAELLILDEENSDAMIQHRLMAVRARPMRQVLSSLRLPVPGRAEALLTAAAEVVTCGGQVRDLARALSITHRTLSRWLLRSHLPAPNELLRWLRGLYAAAMLDDPGQTVYSVASACGYADDRGLQRLYRDLVRMTPTELRRQGAYSVVERAFRREIRTARERVRPLVGQPS